MPPRALFTIALLLAGCEGAHGTRVTQPVSAEGRGRTFEAGPWHGTLDIARVAFGPAYFCAAAVGSNELCPTAVAEMTSVVVIDALGPRAELPPLTAIEGETVRSVAFDFGITWFRTQTAPTPAPAAPGGHSARFEGHAERDGAALRFVADVDLRPLSAGVATALARPAETRLGGEGQHLVVRFDAAAWWAGADLEELRAAGGDPVVVRPEMRAANHVAVRMVATATPEFVWTAP